MRACFLDAGSVGDRLDWSRLEAAADEWRWYHTTRPEELYERIADVDVIVVNKVVIDRKAIEAAPDLKLICLTATGYNNIDIEAAAERDIPVINVTGYATAAVSQHVLALMLAFATRWHDYDAAVARGEWQRAEFFCMHDYPIEELDGATLGIVGYGELGAAVARLAEAFGMRVIVAERPGAERVREGRMPFEDVLAASDFLTLHCPLTEHTRGLIDAAALARMKDTAVLINTARGGVIESRDLIDALENGVIAGAAVDVLDHEPPRDGHPLLEHKPANLIITPHTAWASRAARQRSIDGVAANIAAFRAGDDSARVN
ncbi:D-2-hydroxyacid dehydrogenase [Salinisphaera hydrothermalis]|uniref:Glycerate dehydrogenase n=1 Tax=Salinisphaera hydrothermalis (strain C41B8) TaxID=1304275 RepID=A0A084IR59_SALHC|nr:D-2-hydroxyacid dehydrogenase [Salinisphaera hydrothermalis]KEZ79193.1 glycerate dehydrogenase [Salinisphaera hydrothermalis C41B8]